MLMAPSLVPPTPSFYNSFHNFNCYWNMNHPTSSTDKLLPQILEESKNYNETNDVDIEDKDEDVKEEEEPFVKTWNMRPRKLDKEQKIKNDLVNANKSRRRVTRGQGRPKVQGLVLREKAVVAPNMNVEVVSKMSVFSITLKAKEIEKDFICMTRAMPPKKPMKRPKRVQKQLDACFPGLYLSCVP
ncbi:uncharacterized protein LOC113849264 [Abrus precatorius]|uniref:Uncharacterized protein LOC113849264 n=1 Tax=Abrus precatorius TaxID=3816 RepID=A0A8B8JTK8_ABRPR|nr:uncharacterized protein LOC113849264 [Abrus precatorius]